VVTGAGNLLAVDGKILLDDNALFRHFELAEMRDADEDSPEEQEARRHGLSYVKLDGRDWLHGQRRRAGYGTMDITNCTAVRRPTFWTSVAGRRLTR